MSCEIVYHDDEKSLRLLSMLERLNRGEFINKRQETERYHITEKTFYRDIQTLRCHFGKNLSGWIFLDKKFTQNGWILS